MKSILSLFIIAVIILTGCKADSESEVENKEPIKINPLDRLGQVDRLLSELSEKPQQFEVPSNRETEVFGAKGTLIHMDPNRLETIDGTPLGDKIQIELLEMTDNSNMLLNNTQTVSNGQILVTGGAYYLNMTSDEKQLKMKQGKGLEVEFPKLTDDEMGFFLGERDSLGQMNWIQAEQNFKSKDLEVPEKPKPKKITKKETYSEIASIFGHIDGKEAEPLTQEQIEEFERQKREYETASKTYESVELMNFGWINCDRFLNDPSLKTDIHLLVNNDSLSGARIYAVFNDINSIMTENYWQGMKDTASFKNIPIGKELKIIALSAKNETPFIFETTINTETDKQVKIEFMATTQAEIKEKMKRIN